MSKTRTVVEVVVVEVVFILEKKKKKPFSWKRSAPPRAGPGPPRLGPGDFSPKGFFFFFF